MLERAACRWEPAPTLGMRTCLCAATSWKDVRGAAPRSAAVECGARRIDPPSGASALGARVLTVPNELTNECLWGGSAPPNGSRLSCGAQVGSSQMEFYLDRRAPPAPSAC